MTRVAESAAGVLRPRAAAALLAVAAAALWSLLLAPAAPVGYLSLFVAAWAFLIGGLLVAWQRPGRFAWLLLAVPLSLVPPSLELTREPLLYTLSLALNSAFSVVLVYLVLSFPQGRLTSRVDRLLVTTTVLILLSGILLTTLFDPSRLGCDDCPPGLNLLLVRHDPDLLLWGVRVAGLTIGVNAALVSLRLLQRLSTATPPARRVLAPVAVPAALWFGFHSATRIVRHYADVVWEGVHPIAFLSVVLLALIPFGVLVGLLNVRVRRSRVGDLVVELDKATTDTGLRQAIARTLGDASAEIGFWASDSGRYVTAEGEPLALPASGSGREVAYVEVRGAPLAAIIHDAALLDDPRLVDAVTAAARFAVENQRLHSQLLDKLEEVRASRTRIVEAGDVERRRIERNLHDGAQQDLLALGLRLTTLAQRHDGQLRGELELAAGQARSALAGLRELAHGLHPSVLTDEGLPSALEYLAECATVVVKLEVEQQRHPPPVESTAYFVVAEALANVHKHANARVVDVEVQRVGNDLVVCIQDDGSGGARARAGSGLAGLDDRVQAAGGRLSVTSRPGTGTRIVAEIPCG